MRLNVQDWGLIEYELGLAKQEQLVQIIAQKQLPGTIITCSHPPVITKGRKTQEGDIFDWSGQIVEVKRGGRATYHGPSQLVVYPIINLAFLPSVRPRKDVIWLMRSLENALIDTLKQYGIVATGKAGSNNKSRGLDDTGVWIEDRKIASVGIGVTNWVSNHGIAINLKHDPNAFKGLLPCGYHPSVMTSLETELKSHINWDDFKSLYISKLLNLIDE